ncbi:MULTISPECIES: GntR family transcriptional regulator [Streptomyces]|uniref:GntR family transcriptional regulator n=1 Tax=Streptomyces malaysiensis TaxID=92644 RepID=A0ABX6WJ57_STRMQ|nr:MULTISPECIES: GntR family transcriptional regulator [Streptomyces]MCM3812671.1 GntR family transcriptional regulator [Streptomyces sp. DR7-3]QPI61413.1 GntR family transcriptional regulator [Streptomyces solisilvae]UHH23194.1 GntR family transcriptional regulator [Streptomyces sp. HNM0561]
MPHEPVWAAQSPSPVRRKTLTSQVADRIRADLLTGKFPPGSQLGETELAESLGVSRGPVRESLARLVHEGLLLSRPHRGVFVPLLSEADIIDIYYAREALEAAAFRRVITSAKPPGLLSALDETVDELACATRVGDWSRVADLDVRFHSLVIEAAGSPRLHRMFDTVIAETRLCLNLQANADPARLDLLDEHRELARLIAGDDVHAALAALTQHFAEATVTVRNRVRAVRR